MGGLAARGNGGGGRRKADLFAQLMGLVSKLRCCSHKGCWDDNGETALALIAALRHFTALHPSFYNAICYNINSCKYWRVFLRPRSMRASRPPRH